jgi:hypothetical protein
MGVTVNAFEVAPPRHVPDHHGFFILGELKQMGGKPTGMTPVAKGIGRLHGSTV